MTTDRNDPFLVENPDAFQFKFEPPEPYALVMPGNPIQASWIKRLASDDEQQSQWEPVSDSDLSHEVPERGMVFAAVSPPDGFTQVPPDHTVEVRDIVWRSKQPSWETWSAADLPQEDKTSSEFAEYWRVEHNELLFFARPVNAAGDSGEVPGPTHHRELYVGEIVRRGDKRIHCGLDEWEEVADSVLGATIAAPDEQNGQTRLCRPCSPNQQAWYVNLKAAEGAEGAEEGIGSTENPFLSVESACKAIDAAVEGAGMAAHGVIYALTGDPLFVYDLPEPGVRLGPTDAPAVSWNEGPDTEIGPPDDGGEPKALPGDAVDLAIHWSLSKQEVIEAAFQECNSKFREMVPGEETKAADLWYGPFGDGYDSVMWQPCPADKLGLDPALCDYIFARKQAPTDLKNNVKSQLQGVEQHLKDALATVQAIIAE